jgi:hypothetical protein
MIKGVGSEELGSTHVILLNKNVPANGLRKVVKDAIRFMPANVIYKLVYLIPQIDSQAKLPALPLSASFMLQCYARG